MPGIKGSQNPSNVLIVEDERAIAEMIRFWIEREGSHCTVADSLACAKELLDKESFDAVLLDIGLPDGSGLEFLQYIKSTDPDVIVLMVTANADTKLAIQALTRGAYGYLLKPLEREELLCQLEKGRCHRNLVLQNREQMSQLERRVRDQIRHIRQAHEETIQRLVMACMYRDDETRGHIRRSGLSSALVAQAAGWSTEMVELIQLAAPMHDVGKVGIPDSILRNPGRLTKEEIAIMQTHTTLGAKMLSGSLSPVLQMAEQIAHYHHERWDGTGYPDRLSGGNIPKAARIMAIVDVYDALTHDRVYRPAFPEADVLRKIESSAGTHFDPVIVSAFFDALPGIRKVNCCEGDDDTSDSSEMLPALLDVPMTVAPACSL